MTIEAALVVSGLSLALAVYTGISGLKRAQRSEVQKDAAQITTVIVKLENISAGITEIKSELAGMKNDVRDLAIRVAAVEQSTKAAHKRLDDILAERKPSKKDWE